MNSFKAALGLAAAAGVAVGAIAIAAPAKDAPPAISQAAPQTAPIASAAGGDAGPPVYPSLVNVRLVQTQQLLEDATSAQDRGDAAGAVNALTAARSELAKAWLGAKYVIDNAPPPVAGDDAVARSSGAAPAGGSPYADQYVTTGGVLSLQHTVAVTAMGMLDTASEPLLTTVTKSIFGALNARDVAIAYMKKKDPPAPVAGDGRVHAGASGAPVAAGWSTIGQAVLPDLDDEQQMLDGIRATVKLSPGRAKVLNAVEIQDIKTGKQIDKNWPPVVGD